MMDINVMKAAHEEQPKLLEKVAFLIKLTERLDPESMRELSDEMKTIVTFTNEKVAKVGETALKAAKTLGVALGTTMVAGLGTAVATDLYDAARRKLTKARNMRRILEVNPELKGKDIDQGKLRLSYNALHRFAPEFTADPMIGGAVLKTLVTVDEQAAPGIVKDMLSMRKSLIDSRNAQFKPMNVHIPEKKDGVDPSKLESTRYENQVKLEKLKHDLRESEARGRTLRG